MADSSKALTKEFLAERDTRIFKMKQAGHSNQEIGRRFGVSTQVVGKAISRQLEKLNREALMAYPEVLRMELERLDALQQAIWPMTQPRKQRMDDGTEVIQEPDLKAIQQVLAIIDRRARLLGMEQNNVNIQMDVGMQTPMRATLAGAVTRTASDQFSPETEVRKLLEIMGSSGVMPQDEIDKILGTSKRLNELASGGEIFDAEIIEDSVEEINEDREETDTDGKD
jgi:transposase